MSFLTGNAHKSLLLTWQLLHHPHRPVLEIILGEINGPKVSELVRDKLGKVSDIPFEHDLNGTCLSVERIPTHVKVTEKFQAVDPGDFDRVLVSFVDVDVVNDLEIASFQTADSVDGYESFPVLEGFVLFLRVEEHNLRNPYLGPVFRVQGVQIGLFF